MNNVISTTFERRTDIDHLCCELTSAVYFVALRETTPQNWLDLQLRIWQTIKIRLASCLTEDGRQEAEVT